MSNKENERKRQLAEKIEPELKALIKKHGYEAVNYTWQKTIAKQRELNNALAEAERAQAAAERIKRQLEEM